MSIDVQNLNIQGIKINYYFICKRKLWLFSKGITMEQENDRVISGKIIHENSYKREKNKELLIDNLIRLDIVNKDSVREIKISSKMENADKMQLYYYLYYLKRLGIKKKGILNYVKERKIEEIELTEEKIIEIENIILEIQKIESQKTPPKLKKISYCTKCAYYEFCFAKEEE